MAYSKWILACLVLVASETSFAMANDDSLLNPTVDNPFAVLHAKSLVMLSGMFRPKRCGCSGAGPS